MSAVAWINRSKILFLVLFAFACAGAWTYQLMYEVPKKKCEGAHRWWYGPERACGTPIDITTITGRPRGSPADKEALKAALAKVPVATPAPAPAAKKTP